MCGAGTHQSKTHLHLSVIQASTICTHIYMFVDNVMVERNREREKDCVYVPWGIAARHTLVSLATARGVNRVWIKILGRLTHIVLSATAVTTRLLRKFTHQRTASASVYDLQGPLLQHWSHIRARCKGVQGDRHVPALASSVCA